MNRNAVTIADVAKRAGVSKTTVSHALSGKRPVAPETRARIIQVIEELGFHPNQLARSLRIQQTQLVALIIPDITNPFYPVLARGLQDALKEQGYSMILCNTDSLLQQEMAFVGEAIHRKVDGIALASLYNRAEELRDVIENGGMSFVSIGTGIIHPDVDRVMIDEQQSIGEAINYLLERGHRHIALLGGSQDHTPAQLRLAAYRHALEQAQIPFREEFVVQKAFTREGGELAMRALLARFPSFTQRPTAILCANDLIAIGAMRVTQEAGFSIPEDIAFVGIDDIDAAAFISPSLTTILNPAYEIGQICGRLLLERMQGTYSDRGREVIVPHRFMPRASA